MGWERPTIEFETYTNLQYDWNCYYYYSSPRISMLEMSNSFFDVREKYKPYQGLRLEAGPYAWSMSTLNSQNSLIQQNQNPDEEGSGYLLLPS